MIGQPRHRRLWSLAVWSLVIGLAWLLFGQQVNGQPVVQLDLTAALPGAQPVHGRPAAPPAPHRQPPAPTPQRSPQSSPPTSTPTSTPTSQPPTRAAGAVAFALAQRGKPYVWGAEGPDAYDCSGLVWRAWQHASLAWPRLSAAAQWQWLHSHQVPAGQLRPGDLLFYANNPTTPPRSTTSPYTSARAA